jgi:hypothetical protein
VSATDPAAAQSFLPTIPGYATIEARSLSEALSTVSGGAALLSGNAVLAGLVTRIDGMMQCYQNVGAVAARIYTEANLTSVVQGQIPKIGVLAVVNQDRLVSNFFNCALGGQSEALSAQAAEPQPCSGFGTTTVNGQTIHYIYAATAQELCTIFAQQFRRG